MAQMPKVDFVDHEPRGKGRPRNKEGQINLSRPRSSVKYDVNYAEKTIAKAEKIYKSYEEQRTNPLNVDIKDLCKEAREAWKSIYSRRGLDIADVGKFRRTFDSPAEVLELWEVYCDYIRNHDFVKKVTRVDGEIGFLPIVPNQTSFSRWLGVSRASISSVMRKAEQWQLDMYRKTLADLLSEGAMMGIYQNTMAIFSLKNMCDWADRYEDRPKEDKGTLQTLEEAKELIAKLGLNPVRLLGGDKDGQTDSGSSDDEL